jgi:hypothetical protein
MTFKRVTHEGTKCIAVGVLRAAGGDFMPQP